MSNERWLLEVLVGEKTYTFNYNEKAIVLLDVESCLHGVVDNWVHIQDTYFRASDVKMVSYRKVT